MSDLTINPDTGDLDFTSGDLSLTSGADAIRQNIAMRLRMVVGEWFLDLDAGTDYYGSILGQKNFITADAEFVRVIISTPGVNDILNPLEYNLDKRTRVLRVTFKVDTDEGEITATESVSLPIAA